MNWFSDRFCVNKSKALALVDVIIITIILRVLITVMYLVFLLKVLYLLTTYMLNSTNNFFTM